MNEGEISERVNRVIEGVERASIASGRACNLVTIVAVSKKQEVSLMESVATQLRAHNRPVVFGENYLQEFTSKKPLLAGEYRSHMIGPLQSNKATRATQVFDLIESVHSEKVLRLIETEATRLAVCFPIFLQINISQDPNKAGFRPAECERLFQEIVPSMKSVSVEGLMTITEYYEHPENGRKDFQQMRCLSERLGHEIDRGVALSMGMSADYEIAISEGATHVRIGTALFGERGL